MRHGIESVVPEVFVEAAMPLAQHIQILFLFSSALAAQPQRGRLNLEFVNRALDIGLRLRLLLRPGARLEIHKNSERAGRLQHSFDFTVRGLSSSTNAQAGCRVVPTGSR